MRLYTFVNYYLSSIQQGIQSAHIVGELSRLNDPMYREWASTHKTIIVCNGGNNSDLYRLYAFFQTTSEYPWAMFAEDTASLNGTLTGIGIIIPEFICVEIDSFRKAGLGGSRVELTKQDKALATKIASMSLAR